MAEINQALPLHLAVLGHARALQHLLEITAGRLEITQILIDLPTDLIERDRVDPEEMASRLKRVGEMLDRRSRGVERDRLFSDALGVCQRLGPRLRPVKVIGQFREMRLQTGSSEAFYHLCNAQVERLAFVGQQSLVDGSSREGVAEGHLLGGSFHQQLRRDQAFDAREHFGFRLPR